VHVARLKLHSGEVDWHVTDDQLVSHLDPNDTINK
jgi:hypothetical protein